MQNRLILNQGLVSIKPIERASIEIALRASKKLRTRKKKAAPNLDRSRGTPYTSTDLLKRDLKMSCLKDLFHQPAQVLTWARFLDRSFLPEVRSFGTPPI
jgi:hypothetical protein